MKIVKKLRNYVAALLIPLAGGLGGCMEGGYADGQTDFTTGYTSRAGYRVPVTLNAFHAVDSGTGFEVRENKPNYRYYEATGVYGDAVRRPANMEKVYREIDRDGDHKISWKEENEYAIKKRAGFR